MKSAAFIFDLNGTMINDMDYHINAWYKIVNDLGADISIQNMKEQSYGKNEEVLERIFPGRFSKIEKEQISQEKEKQYQHAYKPNLKLIHGLDKFLFKSKAKGIIMAIGSAAIQSNIDFVLDGLNIRQYFNAIVGAENVLRSKPDPSTFLQAAEAIQVDPGACIVFEDSVKGVEAALNAGMNAVAITTMHGKREFSNFSNIICFIDNYDDLEPGEILLMNSLILK